MEPDVIVADRITKRFGDRDVVDRLSFTVRRGEVFALLGPNGAGKTTCVRMLAGIIRPDAGRIAVSLDGRVTDALPPAHSAYLPEDRELYREIPVLRTLVYFGRLRGLDRREAERRAAGWLERMGPTDRGHERVDALSKGNQQRVQLIAAILHRPALAILDEPFTGLDPVSQEFFLDLVRELRESGTTILLSAHQMDLVERTADRVLLMNRGARDPVRLHRRPARTARWAAARASGVSARWQPRRAPHRPRRGGHRCAGRRGRGHAAGRLGGAA